MESLIIAAQVVFPLIVYMLVGAFIRKQGIMKKEHFKTLNTMVFKVTLPLGIFFDIYETDLGEVLDAKTLLFVVTAILAAFVVSWIIVSKHVKENEYATVMIQGIFRSNYALFGVSIARTICDSEGVALAAALTAVVIPIFNIFAIILFEVKRGGNIRFSRIFLNILKNPLLIAGACGGAVALMGLELPEVLCRPFIVLGDTAAPIALLALGGMLSVGSVMEHRNYLIAVVIARLVILPLTVLTAALAVGFRGAPLIAFLAVFGSPTAVSSVPMAQSMGGNGEMAGEIVALTSVGSIATVFLFVFAMSQIGVI